MPESPATACARRRQHLSHILRCGKARCGKVGAGCWISPPSGRQTSCCCRPFHGLARMAANCPTSGDVGYRLTLVKRVISKLALSSTLYIFLRKRYGEFRAFLLVSFSFETSGADWGVSKILEFPYLVCNEEVTCYLLIQPSSKCTKSR